jgi:hypothetical protein
MALSVPLMQNHAALAATLLACAPRSSHSATRPRRTGERPTRDPSVHPDPVAEAIVAQRTASPQSANGVPNARVRRLRVTGRDAAGAVLAAADLEAAKSCCTTHPTRRGGQARSGLDRPGVKFLRALDPHGAPSAPHPVFVDRRRGEVCQRVEGSIS